MPSLGASSILALFMLLCLASTSTARTIEAQEDAVVFISANVGTNVWNGDCNAIATCTASDPCMFSNTQNINVEGTCLVAIVPGTYNLEKQFTLTNTDVLHVRFSGAISSLSLGVTSPIIDFSRYGANATIQNSDFAILLTDHTTVDFSFLSFVDTTISAAPGGLWLYNTRWGITYCSFTTVSASRSVFTLPLPASAATPSTTHSFTVADSVAYLFDSATGYSSNFIDADVYIDSVNIVSSKIDGVPILLNFNGLGFGKQLTVTNSSISAIRRYMIYTTRFIGKSLSQISDAATIANEVRQANSGPEVVRNILLSATNAIISGRDVPLTAAAPRLSATGVAISAVSSNFSGLSINCALNSWSPKNNLGGSVSLRTTTIHNCAACFGIASTPSFTNVSFTYRTDDTSLMFAYFVGMNQAKMINVSFTDLLEKDANRLVFGGAWNSFTADSSIDTTSLLLDASTTVQFASLKLTGIVKLGLNAQILSAPSPSTTWFFLCPIYFKYSSNTGSALVDLSGVELLHIRPSNAYPYDPGVLSIFYNDPAVSVTFNVSTSIYTKTHIVWDAMRFDIPLSNVPYFIGNFTLRDFDASTPMSGSLQMLKGDEYPFNEVLQAVNAPAKIYRSYFTLGTDSPIYVPTAHWPATPFASPIVNVPSSRTPVTKTPIYTPGAQNCAGSSPSVPSGNSGSFTCLRQSWTFVGNLTVPKSTSFVIPRAGTYTVIQGSLIMEEGSELVFEGSHTELLVDGCVESLKKASFDLVILPSDNTILTAVSERNCNRKRNFEPSKVELSAKGPSGCTQVSVSHFVNLANSVLAVKFNLSKKKCQLIYGVIGGVCAAVAIAGIIIACVIFKKTRKPSGYESLSTLQ